ncbi:MAG: CoA transferase [SAR202 cluster bacterium]|jgi:crotonobetainyl-CoA:carnitine CoA-transferase CaiB-like acyl-CoA transferase|nr:CoA transferase [SAR202 cluster bacterium]MDP6513514.1 CoA transferase [SAR202 cluster bacterium]MDP6714241.1 CoA transferase [SAR202 cluster bacterium]
MPPVLDEVCVLDISHGIAGPLCAKILGDLGADVIKIEPPGGESGRTMAPFLHDDPDPEKSLFFLQLNLNKRGITLNIETPEGSDVFMDLVRRADVVVDSSQPGYLASIGLGYDTLERENPAVLLTSITPFGQTGPYSQFKGEEIVAYATSGIMAISGTSDREPLKHGGFQAQYEAGLNGATGTALALLLRDFTGQGQHLDISTQEVVSSSLVINQPFYSWTGAVQGRRPPEGALFGNIMPCKDGYFISQPGGGATWDAVADFYGREELKEDRFANIDQRAVNGQAMDEIILDATKDRTMNEMFKTASEEYRMLMGIAQTPEDMAECEQLEARGFYRQVQHPVIGTIDVPSRLFNLTDAERRDHVTAPLLGQHNDEVYQGILGYSQEDLARFKQSGVM